MMAQKKQGASQNKILELLNLAQKIKLTKKPTTTDDKQVKPANKAPVKKTPAAKPQVKQEPVKKAQAKSAPKNKVVSAPIKKESNEKCKEGKNCKTKCSTKKESNEKCKTKSKTSKRTMWGINEMADDIDMQLIEEQLFGGAWDKQKALFGNKTPTKTQPVESQYEIFPTKWYQRWVDSTTQKVENGEMTVKEAKMKLQYLKKRLLDEDPKFQAYSPFIVNDEILQILNDFNDYLNGKQREPSKEQRWKDEETARRFRQNWGNTSKGQKSSSWKNYATRPTSALTSKKQKSNEEQTNQTNPEDKAAGLIS